MEVMELPAHLTASQPCIQPEVVVDQEMASSPLVPMVALAMLAVVVVVVALGPFQPQILWHLQDQVAAVAGSLRVLLTAPLEPPVLL
jgi:hypothetical protein